jgi:hypothetical protein
VAGVSAREEIAKVPESGIYLASRIRCARLEEPAVEHTTGLGDIVLLSMLGPSATQAFIWGLGPSIISPTATDDALGKHKTTTILKRVP